MINSFDDCNQCKINPLIVHSCPTKINPEIPVDIEELSRSVGKKLFNDYAEELGMVEKILTLQKVTLVSLKLEWTFLDQPEGKVFELKMGEKLKENISYDKNKSESQRIAAQGPGDLSGKEDTGQTFKEGKEL